ncbi:beta-galactosidase, partial [Myxococcota bacterium]|nr:beta-galactosidase [Myxococcota bacterium]
MRGQRVHIIGGRAEYALLDQESWAPRLRALQGAGFNTVVASVPWGFHEVRPGRFDFTGSRDVAEFLRVAAEVGLWVVLRIGPNVGAPFGGGGLPGWLADVQNSDGKTSLQREADSEFLEAVTRWWSALGKQIVSLQPNGDHAEGPSAGPLLAVQIEQEWLCGNEEAAQAYLGELVHMIREVGIKVPLLTANGFWQEVEGTIETWTNDVDDPNLFANARQLHVVQPNSPRIVTLRGAASHPEQLASAILNVLAAGGMPIVDDAVAGVHRGTIGAAGSNSNGGTTLVPGSIVDVHGQVLTKAGGTSLVARFCRAFGQVLAEFDPNLDVP